MTNTEAAQDAPPSDAHISPPAESKKSARAPSLTILLALACGGVALYAAYGSLPSTSNAPKVDSSNQAQKGDSAPGAHESGAPAGLSGKVKEVVQVSNYTYLRVAPPSGEDFWAAVTKTNVPQGSEVSLEGAELMKNFSSKELGRTFASIYFARISGGGGLDPNHGGVFPAPTKEEGERAKKAAALLAEEIEVRDSAKAEGALGRTVAELYDQGKSIDGKKVRLRGTVVKLTRKVMGTNFLHVRDGSGDAGKGTHDVVLKVAEVQLRLGDEAEFEGTVAVDVDLGSGYSYSLLLQDARVISK